MRLIFDAGAFVGLERADRQLLAMIKAERTAQRSPLTHGGIIGQVWRGGSGRQANLARLMGMVEVVPLDVELGRRSGVLLGRARGSDVIDAALVMLAQDDDVILTSDPDDLVDLAAASGLHLEIARV